MVVRKKDEKDTVEKIKCQNCGKLKASTSVNYYMNGHPLFNWDKFEVCKECTNSYIGEKGSEGYLHRVYSMLALLDKPFLADLWKQRGEEWQRYIPTLSSMKQYKELTFKDSIFLNSNSISDTDNNSFDEITLHEDDLSELIEYWGRGYSDEDYRYLEEEKIKLMSSFECPDYGMEMIMRDICFINLDIEKLRQNKKGSKEIGNLIKTRSDLMNDAKMKPIQATGADANDQLSFGVLVKKWENDRPIPKGLDDEMKNYIDTFMIGHLAKMEGLNNEMTEKYDKALSEYTIDFNELNKNDEYEDD
ncbi:hypothetical protein [Paenibacillus naphthalenovorans]|uniref:Uncharacterized protein n=1 Tax=Paenibacillus naphthalenovorans TaxID=162209 RepID=A0A0U2U7G0_9BACL|nr:hypothetical protein [Paenibacillus naphthalenovorans]ALS22297.1 hypothetical protein IJ22_19230 [Paenibacillus naphthalenovorans]